MPQMDKIWQNQQNKRKIHQKNNINITSMTSWSCPIGSCLLQVSVASFMGFNGCFSCFFHINQCRKLGQPLPTEMFTKKTRCLVWAWTFFPCRNAPKPSDFVAICLPSISTIERKPMKFMNDPRHGCFFPQAPCYQKLLQEEYAQLIQYMSAGKWLELYTFYTCQSIFMSIRTSWNICSCALGVWS